MTCRQFDGSIGRYNLEYVWKPKGFANICELFSDRKPRGVGRAHRAWGAGGRNEHNRKRQTHLSTHGANTFTQHIANTPTNT